MEQKIDDLVEKMKIYVYTVCFSSPNSFDMTTKGEIKLCFFCMLNRKKSD